MIINVLIINSMFLHVDSRAPELPPVLSGVRVTQSSVFCVVFCRSFCLFFFFLAIVVSSALLRFMVSVYPFGIFHSFSCIL